VPGVEREVDRVLDRFRDRRISWTIKDPMTMTMTPLDLVIEMTKSWNLKK